MADVNNSEGISPSSWIVNQSTAAAVNVPHVQELSPEDKLSHALSNSKEQFKFLAYKDDKFDFIMFNIVCPLLYCLITLIGIAGNSLVIYVILTRNNMRTITNLLLLNLAMADIAFVMICPPFTAYQFAVQQWPFGDVLCKLMHYIINVTCYVTIYTLVLISVIRYMTIVHNHRTVKIRTRTNVVVFMAGIWAIMLTVNIPITWTYGVLTVPDSGELDCEVYSYQSAKIVFATLFVCAYLLPLLVIATLSIAIVCHICGQNSTLVDARPQSQSRKRNASRLLILVVVVFALLWLPIHIHLLWNYFGTVPRTKTYVGISIFFNPLAYFNSCVNPFIYNYYSKDFRDSFRDVVCFFCRRIRSNNSLQMRAVGRCSVTKTSPDTNGSVLGHKVNELEIRGLISKQETEVETIDMHAPGEIYIGEIKKDEYHERKMSYERKESCK